jgi:hypothetical protein
VTQFTALKNSAGAIMSTKIRTALSALTAAAIIIVVTAEPALAAGPVSFKQRAARSTNLNAPGAIKAASKAADSYTFKDIEIPGAVYVVAVEINNSGAISGVYGDAQGRTHSFVLTRDRTITIDYPGATFTSVASITNSGLLFGNWGSVTEQHAGYYNLHTGQWTQLPDLPGYPVNIGNRMNNAGRAVGYACRDTFFELLDCIGWLWTGKEYQLIDVPGAISTYAYGINDRGQIVGVYSVAPFVFEGFLSDGGNIQPLTITTEDGVLPATAYDITDDGRIVAVAPLGVNVFWPPILIDKQGYELLPEYPGVVRTFYQGINQRGDLVGLWFNDPADPPRSFVAYRK